MPIFDLGLEHVGLAYATKTIFDDVTLGVFEGDRIGIVGRNGDGKSTLLKLLSNAQSPDSGQVTRRNSLTLGVLGQSDTLDDDDTVLHAALGDREEHEWAANTATRQIVEALIGDIDVRTRIGELSGGQRRRVDLTRLLLEPWDILALDEPTNHLDIVTIHWLAEHLKNRWGKNQGALLVVTHDRWFLDEVCSRMWEVHDRRIDPFEGGYSAYMLQRVERDRQADVNEWKRQNLARKELAWLARGARARATKQKFHVKEARELIADVPPVRNQVELKAMATSRLGKQVVDVVDVTQRFGDGGGDGTSSSAGKKILDDVTWLIGPGDRFGIIGRNGAGKSTLLNIIDGTLTPTQGHVKIGKTVKFAVLSQRLEAVDALGDSRVTEILGRYRSAYIVDGKEVSPAKLLERLGFESAQLMTPVCDLSGGQKRRLQLLLILLDEPNVLIMDEPGNDLDTDMLAVMEDLLDSWAGTLVVVSHDSYLLERVTDSQFALIDGTIRHLPGGVDDYFKLLAAGDGDGNGNGSGSDSKSGDTDASATHVNQYENSKRMSAIERRLEKIDTLRAGLVEKMAQIADAGGTDFEKLADLQGQIARLDSEQSQLESEWDGLAEL